MNANCPICMAINPLTTLSDPCVSPSTRWRGNGFFAAAQYLALSFIVRVSRILSVNTGCLGLASTSSLSVVRFQTA